MNKRRRTQPGAAGPTQVDLNLMPFIDIFSLLTTFLLFSAVFVNIGFHEVQIPFLSNKVEENEEQKKPTKVVSVDVELDLKEIGVVVKIDGVKDEKKFDNTEAGLAAMHNFLVQTRVQNPESDKVTLFVEDDVKYNQVSQVLDSIKLLNPSDPKIPLAEGAGGGSRDTELGRLLYEKVIMGSVLL